jgi:hypothetical protein
MHCHTNMLADTLVDQKTFFDRLKASNILATNEFTHNIPAIAGLPAVQRVCAFRELHNEFAPTAIRFVSDFNALNCERRQSRDITASRKGFTSTALPFGPVDGQIDLVNCRRCRIPLPVLGMQNAGSLGNQRVALALEKSIWASFHGQAPDPSWAGPLSGARFFELIGHWSNC